MADAVSGVVNLILKKNYEGLEARARGGITSRGDGESYGGTLTAGKSFDGGRGNVTFAASTTGWRAYRRSIAATPATA
jgi:hypothetical protein